MKGASHSARLFLTVLAAWQHLTDTFTYGSGDTKARAGRDHRPLPRALVSGAVVPGNRALGAEKKDLAAVALGKLGGLQWRESQGRNTDQ